MQDFSLNTTAMLLRAIENGIINLDTVQQELDMKENKKYLDMHKYTIYQGKDKYWCTYLPDDKKGRKFVRKTKKEALIKAIVDYYRKEEINPTIRLLFQEWNQGRLERGKISEPTFIRNNQTYNRHCKEFGERRIRNITAFEVCEFLENEVYEKKLGSKAFANLKGIIKGTFKYARRKDLINFSVVDMMNDIDVDFNDYSRKIRTDQKESFSKDEYDRIIEYCIAVPTLRNLAVLFIMVTGCRVGEVVALKKEDVNIDDGTVFIHRMERRYQRKGHNEYEVIDKAKTNAGIRYATVPKDYLWIFKKIKKENPFSEWMFFENRQRLQADYIRRQFYKICKKLNIDRKSPHVGRKTYCSILFENNVDPKMIVSQMGHTQIDCSDTYYHKDRTSISERSNTISNISDFQKKKA